jgi:CheY-like chemotaxis protein
LENETTTVLLAKPAKDLHVLIVDDSFEMLEILSLILKRSGVFVTEAKSVDEVFSILKQIRPHIIISDIEMPGADGYELVRRLHSLPQEYGGNIPIAALTAHHNENEQKKIESAGFNMRLQKPIKPEHLINAVIKLSALT